MNKLPSHHQLNESVCVKLDEVTPALHGNINAITFTESSVYYDVEVQFDTLIRVASSLVGKVEIIDAPEVKQ